MKLGYVILYVNDVNASLALYERAFGLERGFVSDTGHYAELKTGTTTLAFADAKTAKPEALEFHANAPDKPSAPVEIAFVTQELAAAYKRALECGCKSILVPTTKPWGQDVAYVRDTNGFLIELCTPVGGA